MAQIVKAHIGQPHVCHDLFECFAQGIARRGFLSAYDRSKYVLAIYDTFDTIHEEQKTYQTIYDIIISNGERTGANTL